MRSHHLPFVCGFLFLALACGCARKIATPDLGGIYNRSAMYHGRERNPVIVIPGILGSKLKVRDTGQVAWGAFTGTYVNPRTLEGARIAALPMREGAAVRELTDEIVPDGALDRVKLAFFGVPLSVNAYAGILATLGAGGYRDETLGKTGAIDYGSDHYTCFQFDYDWRRDNVENAQRLHQFILEKRAVVKRELEKRGQPVDDEEIRFDIVAHSMGGLVARYYLMYGDADLPSDGRAPAPTWAGARHVEKLIQVGTPNAGAVDALVQLVKGAQIAPILPKYEPAILGTMPSIYQLLPRPRHGQLVDARDRAQALDFYDVNLWERMDWGLMSRQQIDLLRVLLPEAPDDEARRRIARDHLVKCLDRARQFHAALDLPSSPPPGTTIALMAGDAVPTNARLVANPETGALTVIAVAPGDGTVLRSSALMDERLGPGEWSPHLVTPIAWSQVNFFFTNHLGLTTDPGFTDNVLYLLLEKPPDTHIAGSTASVR